MKKAPNRAGFLKKLSNSEYRQKSVWCGRVTKRPTTWIPRRRMPDWSALDFGADPQPPSKNRIGTGCGQAYKFLNERKPGEYITRPFPVSPLPSGGIRERMPSPPSNLSGELGNSVRSRFFFVCAYPLARTVSSPRFFFRLRFASEEGPEIAPVTERKLRMPGSPG